jgi:hypothetical protein
VIEPTQASFIELGRRIRESAVHFRDVGGAAIGPHKLSHVEWGYGGRFGILEGVRDRVYWRSAYGDEAAYPIDLTGLDSESAWKRMSADIPAEGFAKGSKPS